MTESHPGTAPTLQMDQPPLLATLSALADQGVKRTKTGQLRELLPQIEQAQSAGYSNEAIARALTERGLPVSKKTLETMLYRIRKATPSAAAAPAPSSTTSHGPALAEPSAPPQLGGVQPLPPPAKRITNPTQIRQARNKAVDLDDYLNPNPEE